MLVGSLSQSSFNRKIADYLRSQAPDSLNLIPVDLSDLPVYDRDLDNLSEQPESYTRLRQEITAADGIIFITPEHNAGIPALLKNAIDICTRPVGTNLWEGKPVGIITASAAMAGGQRVGDQLRAICSALAAPVLPIQTPISRVFSAFNDSGQLTNESVQKRLNAFISSYTDFVPQFAA